MSLLRTLVYAPTLKFPTVWESLNYSQTLDFITGLNGGFQIDLFHDAGLVGASGLNYDCTQSSVIDYLIEEFKPSSSHYFRCKHLTFGGVGRDVHYFLLTRGERLKIDDELIIPSRTTLSSKIVYY